jgi:hypothetical protein
VIQAASGNELHDQTGPRILGHGGLINLDNVRVIEPGQQASLFLEAGHLLRPGPNVAWNLDGHNTS